MSIGIHGRNVGIQLPNESASAKGNDGRIGRNGWLERLEISTGVSSGETILESGLTEPIVSVTQSSDFIVLRTAVRSEGEIVLGGIHTSEQIVFSESYAPFR